MVIKFGNKLVRVREGATRFLTGSCGHKPEGEFHSHFEVEKYFAGRNFSQRSPGAGLGHLKPGIASNLRTKNVLLVGFFLTVPAPW
jgi:hypothetical protein